MPGDLGTPTSAAHCATAPVFNMAPPFRWIRLVGLAGAREDELRPPGARHLRESAGTGGRDVSADEATRPEGVELQVGTRVSKATQDLV
jgi:hypothetical protein